MAPISLTSGIGRTDTSLSSQGSGHQRPASTAGILQHQHGGRNNGLIPGGPPQSLTPQPTLSDHLNHHQHHQTSHHQGHELHNIQTNSHHLLPLHQQQQREQQQSISLHQLQHHQQQNQMNLIDSNVDGRGRAQPQLSGTNIANWLDEKYLKLEPPNSPAEKRVRLEDWRTQQSSTIT